MLSQDSNAVTGITSDVAAAIADRQPLRYAGYAYDAHAATYYLSQRHYDPATARFLTKDPARDDGEESAYQYCAGDPVGRVDPTGLHARSYKPYSHLHVIDLAQWFRTFFERNPNGFSLGAFVSVSFVENGKKYVHFGWPVYAAAFIPTATIKAAVAAMVRSSAVRKVIGTAVGAAIVDAFGVKTEGPWYYKYAFVKVRWW